eukprot:101831-Chlamydomonas_euryale.AAC.1
MVLIQGSLSDLGETVSADLGAKRAPSSASDGDDADPSRNAASGPRVLPSQAVQQAHPIISGNDIHVAPSVMVWTPDYFGEAAKQEVRACVRAHMRVFPCACACLCACKREAVEECDRTSKTGVSERMRGECDHPGEGDFLASPLRRPAKAGRAALRESPRPMSLLNAYPD